MTLRFVQRSTPSVLLLTCGFLACGGTPSNTAPAGEPGPPRPPVPATGDPVPRSGPGNPPPGVISPGPPIDPATINMKHSGSPVVGGRCPTGMVPVPDAKAPLFCIDAWEGLAAGDLGAADQYPTWPEPASRAASVSRAGVKPTTAVSWYQASAACKNAGKHLCTVAEWTDACDGLLGPGGSAFPWGDSPDPVSRCATQSAAGPAIFKEVQPTGSLPDCRGPIGAYDLVGNAWEWADPGLNRADGTPVAAKLGAAFYSGRPPAGLVGVPDHGRCDTAPALEHPPQFAGSIGFRCCRPPEVP